MAPVIAFFIITMVALAGGVVLLWVHDSRKTARLAAAAQRRHKEQWEHDNWHFRTYGWVPQRRTAAKKDDSWFVVGWWF